MKKVNLNSIAQELEAMPNEWRSYFDFETGEAIMINSEAIYHVEKDENEEDYIDGPTEEIQLAKDILNNDKRYLLLPDKSEFDDYKIMENYCYSVDKEKDKYELLGSIKGSGAFRRFRDCVERLGRLEEWYKFRTKEYEDIVKEWCKLNNIEIE